MIRLKVTTIVSVWLLLLAASVRARGAERPVAIPCGSSHSKTVLLETNESKNFVALFGYQLRHFDCAQITSKWLANSTVIQFRSISTELDDVTIFTLIADHRHRLWLIPISRGMLEYPSVTSDPHNLAAFNALLQDARKAPKSADEWAELALCYLALVGHPAYNSPSHPDYSVTATKECSGPGCEVNVTETLDGTKTSWSLRFQIHNGQAALTDVSKDVNE